MNVLIVGSYGERNLGDDSLMYCIYRYCQNEFPEIDLIFTVDHVDDYLKKFCPRADFVSKESLNYDCYDLVVYGGGTQFFSFIYDDSDTRFVVFFRKLMLSVQDGTLCERIKQRILKKKRNKFTNILGLGLGLGPFDTQNSEAKAREVLSNFKWVALRDAVSLKYARSWGLGRVVSGADICFYSDLWYHQCRRATRRGGIGIIVRDWSLTKDRLGYLETLLNATDDGVLFGKPVTYIVFSDKGDARCIQKIKQSGENIVIWNPSIMNNISMFVSENLACFELIISARYHGIVLSSVAGVPGIAIGLDPKISQLERDLPGTSAWNAPFIEKDLEEKVNRFFQNMDSCRLQLKRSVDQNKKRSKLMFDTMKEVVLS